MVLICSVGIFLSPSFSPMSAKSRHKQAGLLRALLGSVNASSHTAKKYYVRQLLVAANVFLPH
jgi:hypothetical protein